MLNEKDHHSTCEFAAEIVSYIYNENTFVEGQLFEKHLGECTFCVEEFAAISEARFDIYEWHKEAFVPLSTPEIVIPYPVRSIENVGLLAGFREFLTGSWPSLAAAFGGLALVVAFAAVFFSSFSSGPEQIARNDAGNQAGSANNTIRTEVNSSGGGTSTLAVVPTETVVDIPQTGLPAKAISGSRTRRPLRQLQASTNRSNSVRTQGTVATAPSLSGVGEEADNSLRLSDLFDEIGSLR